MRNDEARKMDSLQKALQLLNYVAQQPLGVIEAADKLGVHKSTTSRLFHVLQKENFVHLNHQKKYELGSAVYDLANIWMENLDIKEITHPYIEKLSAQIDETIHLAILSGSQVTYIDKIDSSKTIRMHSRIGLSNPAYCTGIGKVLLAHLPNKEVVKVMANVELKPFTDNTITSMDKLLEELESIRRQGIAFDNMEHDDKIICVAAPVFDYTKHVVAGISISSPVAYVSYETLKDYVPALVKTAMEVSMRLGYTKE